MEPVKTQAVLISEMNSLRTTTLSSTKESEDNDEISKELEDQLLYDEEDALSDDSIRLRVSDDEADGENSGASGPVNSQLKKKSEAELLESTPEDCASVKIPLNQPSVQNGVDTKKKMIEDKDKMIDFADDDTSLDDNFLDGCRNGIIFGEEGKDKFPMFNQFPQSAYDDSWRLTGEIRNRFGNRGRTPHYSRYSNRHYDFSRRNASNKGYVNPYHREIYWESKTASPSVSNKYSPRSFPPSSKKKPEVTVNSVTVEKPESDSNTSQNLNIQPSIDKTDSKLDNSTQESKLEKPETLKEKSKTVDSKEPEKDSEETIQEKPKENGIPNDEIAVNDKTPTKIDSNEKKNVEENNKVVVVDNLDTNIHDDEGEVEKNDETKEDSFVEVPVKIEEHSTNTEPMTEESSDSGIASITTSITPVDEISKDDNEEIREKTVQDDSEPPVLELMDVVESTVDTIPSPKAKVDTEVGKNSEKAVVEIEPEISKLNDVVEPIEVDENHQTNVSESIIDDQEKVKIIESSTAEESEKPEIVNGDGNDDDDDDGIIEIAIEKPQSTGSEKVVVDLVDSAGVSAESVESTNSGDAVNANEKLILLEESKPEQKVDNSKEDEEIVDPMDQAKLDKRGPGRPPKRKRNSIRGEEASIGTVAEKENVRFREKRETAQKAEERIRKDLGRRKYSDDSEESDQTNHLQFYKVAEKEYTRFREKRETAQKAEELIRKESARQKHSDESENSNDVNRLSNLKANNIAGTASPVAMKRVIDEDENVDSGRVKKPKNEPDNVSSPSKQTSEPVKLETKSNLGNLRNFLLRDAKQKLTKLTQEQLEELLIQKMIETITMGAEIGKLREEAKNKERETEISRAKCQQLSKQIKDFEMVLNRYAADRRNTAETHVTPIKINRSVGLQVNFLGDHGIQNLRQVNSSKNSPKASPKPLANGLSSPAVQFDDSIAPGRRGLKVRSPRRSDGPATSPVIANVQTPVQNQTHINTSMTPSIVVNKVTDSKSPTTTIQVSQSILSNPSIVINGNISNQQNRQVKVLSSQNNKTENLIDLTEEEEKTKISPSQPPMTALITPVTTSTTVPKLQPRSYPRVISSTPANIPMPPTSLRVVQPSGQPTPTAIVNNVNTQRFLVMQPGAPPRQLLITSNANTQIGTASAANTRSSFPGLTYTGVSGLPNGTALRVVPSTGTATIQMFKVTHPAPLPEVTIHQTMPGWKLPPPAPSLKISKVTHGIVLSWNMGLSDKYAEIASYQLYAYQEIPGLAPSSTLWKKVGDVRALPLPMACTLTQFSEGNNYYFAVRAVDTHSRLGQYSPPGNISL